jgi:hypothetical protein
LNALATRALDLTPLATNRGFVGVRVGEDVGVGDGVGLGLDVGVGVGVGVGDGVGLGVGEGVGVGVGLGVVVTDRFVEPMTVPDTAMIIVSPAP